MTERTVIGQFYIRKVQACGGLTVSVSGLNAFLERVWAVGGCSAFSVPSLYVFLSTSFGIIQVHIHVGHLTHLFDAYARHELNPGTVTSTWTRDQGGAGRSTREETGGRWRSSSACSVQNGAADDTAGPPVAAARHGVLSLAVHTFFPQSRMRANPGGKSAAAGPKERLARAAHHARPQTFARTPLSTHTSGCVYVCVCVCVCVCTQHAHAHAGQQQQPGERQQSKLASFPSRFNTWHLCMQAVGVDAVCLDLSRACSGSRSLARSCSPPARACCPPISLVAYRARVLPPTSLLPLPPLISVY